MKILRSATQRGSHVGVAGWFTILTADKWFPASRLPKMHRDVTVDESMQPPSNRDLTAAPEILKPETQDRRPVRRVLVILGAIAIAWGLLWWIIESQFR